MSARRSGIDRANPSTSEDSRTPGDRALAQQLAGGSVGEDERAVFFEAGERHGHVVEHALGRGARNLGRVAGQQQHLEPAGAIGQDRDAHRAVFAARQHMDAVGAERWVGDDVFDRAGGVAGDGAGGGVHVRDQPVPADVDMRDGVERAAVLVFVGQLDNAPDQIGFGGADDLDQVLSPQFRDAFPRHLCHQGAAQKPIDDRIGIGGDRGEQAGEVRPVGDERAAGAVAGQDIAVGRGQKGRQRAAAVGDGKGEAAGHRADEGQQRHRDAGEREDGGHGDRDPACKIEAAEGEDGKRQNGQQGRAQRAACRQRRCAGNARGVTVCHPLPEVPCFANKLIIEINER